MQKPYVADHYFDGGDIPSEMDREIEVFYGKVE